MSTRPRHFAMAASLAFAATIGVPASSFAQESGSDERADAESSDQESGGELQRSDQMQFDARLVRGERASGAVFLFERTARRLPSLVDKRRTYLGDSVQSVLGDDWAEQYERRRKAADEGDDEATDEDNDDPDLELSLTDDAGDGD